VNLKERVRSAILAIFEDAIADLQRQLDAI
jgi:hypothetical protein